MEVKGNLKEDITRSGTKTPSLFCWRGQTRFQKTIHSVASGPNLLPPNGIWGVLQCGVWNWGSKFDTRGWAGLKSLNEPTLSRSSGGSMCELQGTVPPCKSTFCTTDDATYTHRGHFTFPEGWRCKWQKCQSVLSYTSDWSMPRCFFLI